MGCRPPNWKLFILFWAPQVRACNWKLFILYLNQNIYCKEPPQWDDSFENHWYERVTETDLSSFSMKTYVVGSQYSLLIPFQSRLNETVLLSNQKHTAAGPQIRACSSWRLFILFLNHTIYCGYSKRPPQWDGEWDGSFERPQNTHFYWWIKYNCNFTLLAAIMAHVRSRVRVFAPKNEHVFSYCFSGDSDCYRLLHTRRLSGWVVTWF